MSRFDTPDDDWSRHRALQLDINRRHGEWLLDVSKKLSEIEKQLAILTARITLWAAIGSVIATAIVNWVIKALTAPGG